MHDAYRHVVVFFFYRDGDHRDLHSFPTRRSSDLEALEQRFLRQSGFRLSLSRFHDLYDEGLIGKEVFEDLEREHAAVRSLMDEMPPLDHSPCPLGLNWKSSTGTCSKNASCSLCV